MGIFDDILKNNIESKIEQFLNHEKNRKKFNDLKDELDNFLKENYGNERYYDSLDRYIHNGNVSLNTYSNDKMSGFYYTLFCAFFNSDDNFLGENNFPEYHWAEIQKLYPNDKYEKNNIKKCFSHFYNTFKSEFGSPSDINIASVNSIKHTVITTRDCVIDALSNESASIRETIKESLAEIHEQSNEERGIQSEKESLVNKIYDYNNEYQERLKDPLFLESDLDDDRKATLADVYIKPHIKLDFCDLKRWAENRDSRILLVYGKAGIGKTSYLSWLSLNNNFTQDCHILELRQCIHILNSNNPWKSIKKSFRCMSNDEYQNKVLILDGLDEVCSLKSKFDGYKFIENLSNTLRTGFGRSIRIIITSRMGYFSKINRNNHVDVATIFWEEDSVIDWCDKYCQMHNNKVEWCESFKKTYADLKTYDKRKDVFCTPLILYICCVSQVDISKHNSAASIYDEAFNVIGTRQYNEWTEASKEEFEINRQFTKELAFQMFLNDKLEEVLCSNFVQIAKEKVVDWAQKKYLYQIKELEFEKLFAINHFAYGKNDAIEFAHKTIGEYFTAVKLYEDYFENIDGTIENTWCNIFNSFRYKTIPIDIMQYLIDLILSRKGNNWIENFFKAYYIGMKNQSLHDVVYFKSEYSTSCSALIYQMQIVFRNLTWLLTGLGFDNSKFINTEEDLEILASYFHGDVKISRWKNLDNINLSNSYLEGSKFEHICIKNAYFKYATLINVSFYKAILERSEFIGANLKRACLIKSDFTEANFTEANLEEANLEEANLNETNFSEANLIKANLTKVELKGACLKGANLTGADLRGADLTEADLTGADFTGAYLTEADFTGADFTGADFTGADLKGANLTGVILTGANFNAANLKGVDLTKVDLTRVDLTKAVLK